MPTMTKSKVFEIAMADMEKAAPADSWPQEVQDLVSAGREKNTPWANIASVLNTHYFSDRPLSANTIRGRWIRRKESR